MRALTGPVLPSEKHLPLPPRPLSQGKGALSLSSCLVRGGGRGRCKHQRTSRLMFLGCFSQYVVLWSEIIPTDVI